MASAHCFRQRVSCHKASERYVVVESGHTQTLFKSRKASISLSVSDRELLVVVELLTNVGTIEEAQPGRALLDNDRQSIFLYRLSGQLTSTGKQARESSSNRSSEEVWR